MGWEENSEETVWMEGVSTSIRLEVEEMSVCSTSGGAGARAYSSISSLFPSIVRCSLEVRWMGWGEGYGESKYLLGALLRAFSCDCCVRHLCLFVYAKGQ
jgi:hypothetical protein